MGCRIVEEPPPPSSMPAELSRARTQQESSSSTSAASQAMSPPRSSSFMSTPGFLSRKSRQPSESRLFGILPSLPNRSRSKTISATDVPGSSSSSSTSTSAEQPPPEPMPGAQQFQAQESGEQEVHLFLSFSTQRQKDEWYAIFRSLARVPLEEGRKARPHRRLKICVLDIQEVQALSMAMPDLDGSSSQQDGSIASDSRPGPGKSPGKRSKADTLEIKRVMAKPGWSWRDQIRVELCVAPIRTILISGF